MNIIHIDDDSVDREALKRILEKEFPGCHVHSFHKAAEALKQAVNPSLLILEYLLPECVQGEVCESLNLLYPCPCVIYTWNPELPRKQGATIPIFSKAKPPELLQYIRDNIPF